MNMMSSVFPIYTNSGGFKGEGFSGGFFRAFAIIGLLIWRLSKFLDPPLYGKMVGNIPDPFFCYHIPISPTPPLSSTPFSRAGSSIRLVRLKPQSPGPKRGPDHPVKRKFSTTLGPEMSISVCRLLTAAVRGLFLCCRR